MQILLSKGTPATTPCATLPAKLQKFKIPSANPQYGECTEGCFLLQHLPSQLCDFWHHHYEIFRQIEVNLEVPSPCVLLLFILSGDAHCSGNNGVFEKMEAGYCHCYCVPEGLYTMRLDPGSYTFAQTELSPTALPLLKLTDDTQVRLQQYLETPSSQTMHLHGSLINTGLRHVLSEIENCPYNDEDRQQLYYEDKIHQLVTRFSLHVITDKKKHNESRPTLIQNICEYIHIASAEHLVTIAELTRKFGICRTKLTALFKSHTNQPIGQYIHSVRMEMAKELLLDTDLPVGAIACEKLHYEYITSFCKAFKTFYGDSPATYRCRRHFITPDNQNAK